MGCGSSASSSGAAAPAGSSNTPAPATDAAACPESKNAESAAPLSRSRSYAQGNQTLVWIAGETCAGKTFMGDYLATRGYHHIDGDFGNQSQDPKIKTMWTNLFKAIKEFNEEGKADEALWKPYFQVLIDMFNAESAKGKDVVLFFAVLNLFGEKDWIADSIPGIKFFKVDVSRDVILERALVRNRKIVEIAGSSVEEMWTSHEMAEAREHYGEEFTEEGFRKCNEVELFALKYIACEPTDGWVTFLPNNDLDSFEGIKKLNEVLGLEWVDIDKDAVAQINYERMKNIDLSLPT